MRDFAFNLKKFYLDLIEGEIKENGVLDKRVKQLTQASNSEENVNLEDANLILDSILDALSISIVTGNIDRSRTSFEFKINDITNLGDESDRNELLNDYRSGSLPKLFETRVRAWYSNLYDIPFTDLDNEYSQSVCEFAIQERYDSELDNTQLVECKRFNSSSSANKNLKENFRDHYQKAISQMESTEEAIDSVETGKKHLILDVSKRTREIRKLNEDKKYTVLGPRKEDIEEIKREIREVKDKFEADQITLVWKNTYKDGDLIKCLVEHTEKLKQDKNIRDYAGWTINPQIEIENNKSYRGLRAYWTEKRKEWIIADFDADPSNQTFFIQEPAREISEE